MDIQWLYGFIGILSGILLGGGVVWFSLQQRLADKNRLLQDNIAQLALLDETRRQAAYWQQAREQSEQSLENARHISAQQEAEIRELTTRLEESRLAAEEKQRLLLNSEQRLNTQFENLAARIFEQSGRRTDELNRQSLSMLLRPFREQLDNFNRQVQESYSQESRERHTLTHEIQRLQQLNLRMAQEAVNLTNALKGDNKMQGNWGETILARILEASGLREGHEFATQVSLKNEQQSRYQPDVVIYLPQNKQVIVDAKVSLVAYERYFNSDTPDARQAALTEHINSVRQHIRGLSRKEYQDLSGINSLDYVLMFIPVEPAFLAAVGQESVLLDEALRSNIMLVSPSTLLVALRTIANLWRYEHQHENSQAIAQRAARLYDKLRLFTEEMDGIGQALDKAQSTYHGAMKKLTTGRGNLLSQAESFRELGVEVKRPLDEILVQKARLSEQQDTTADELPEEPANFAEQHNGHRVLR
ncbi:DNA recombination protein RmuC [Morganella morganii]|uniref:DNA recombination protein RmuC n=1 Tax=bacterium 19GA11TI05 TaxID=2920688 RepID=A0AAU6TVA4_UNCXX|nr:DNA recombination protein RmuC [Morganella morganii]MDW7795824.1 DNA recombination protein RmuC [Morganella morganii]HDS3819171.1 DNA recombination protein RmuC [Morganella morganii subsp. morganii]